MDESITKDTPKVEVNDKKDDISHNEVEDNKENVQLNSKKDKSTTSNYRKYSKRIGINDDGKDKASCNGYNKKYDTFHLKHHFEKCNKIKYEDVRQMILEGQEKLKVEKIH